MIDLLLFFYFLQIIVVLFTLILDSERVLIKTKKQFLISFIPFIWIFKLVKMIIKIYKNLD